MTQETQTNRAFNFDATYGFVDGSMFLQQSRGLIDSIHRKDTTTFDRYKRLDNSNWAEDENPHERCLPEFADPKNFETGEMMVNNVGWQWSGDSNAANSLIPLIAPFAPSSDAWLWYVLQGKNENLHALSYSEIVKTAIPGGLAAIHRVQQNDDMIRRVEFIANVFDHVIKEGARITLGDIDMKSDRASDALMLGLAGIMMFERIQFMASFANTAAIHAQNKFVPICMTVRKIAFDEWNTHIPQCRYTLEHEMKVPQRMESLRRIRPQLRELGQEIIHNEIAWNKRQFAIGGKSLLGMTEEMGADYVYYAGTDVDQLLGLDMNIKRVTRNPLKFMDEWLEQNSEQNANMEVKGLNYMVGGMQMSPRGRQFDTRGLS